MTAGRRPLYEPLDYFVVRAPLFPVERYERLCRPEPTVPASEQRPGGLPDDMWERRAVAVGSPALYRALVRSPVDSEGREALARKLLRYRIRMSTRPTPYGLFAGVALGSWAARSDLALADEPPATRTRPDMEWLTGLVREAEANPEIRRAATVLTEPSCFEHAGRVHLAHRPGNVDGAAPDVSVRATAAVRCALALARHPLPYPQLVAGVLAAVPGATPEKVHLLCDELWRYGLLRTDLHPPLTLGNPSAHVLSRLPPVPAARAYAVRVESAVERATAFDRTGAPTADLVAPLIDVNQSFQVDSSRALAGRDLTSRVATDVGHAVELLLRLHPAPGGPHELWAYRQVFKERYGWGRLVPVPELLDPRFGLGPPARYGGRPMDSPATRRTEALAAMLATAQQDRSVEVELSGQWLEMLQTWTPTPAAVPVSLELSAFLAATSRDAVDRGDYLLVVGPNLGGSSAGKGLGRFGDLLGAAGRAALERTARAEQARDPRSVRAELVYAPTRLRAANVAVRPGLGDYEIPVGVTPGCPPDRVIRPDELAVCVSDGRLRLWWPARDVEVKVTAGHMLNNTAAPALCEFLDAIGSDGVTQLTGFSWGPFAGAPFLPRVRVGRIVLQPARWQLGASSNRELDLPSARAKRPADEVAAFEARLRAWRERWGVPRHVYLADGDNRLLLDLDEPAHVDQLRDDLRRGRGRACLEEALPDVGHAWLPGPGGRYLSEMVVPLVRRAPILASRPEERPIVAPAAARRRPPGSDWLYLKLYGPPSSQDAILSGALRAFADEATASAEVSQWFFVRYADPDPHLRVRFHGQPDRLRGFLPAAAVWAGDRVANGQCDRFTVDVYEREIERYGGEAAMAIAERLFCVDSVATAALLDLTGRAATGLPSRTDLALLTVDDLVTQLDLDEHIVARMCEREAIPAKESATEFRARRRSLEELFATHRQRALSADGDGELQAILRTRRQALSEVAAELQALEDNGLLGLPVELLAASYVHLHCNRLLGPDRSTERLVLGLLRRLRTSLRYQTDPRPARDRVRSRRTVGSGR